jgi:hypothetical protein
MIAGYLLDENLPRAWRGGIVRMEPAVVVWCVGDPSAPPLRSPDPVILGWCEAHQAILLTNNRESMPGHLADHVAQGRHVPGIFVVDPSLSIRQLARTLALIAGASLEDEYQDQIRYLPVI